MINLQKLKKKILDIPEKRKRSDFVGTLRQYQEKVQKSRVKLERAINGQRMATFVFHEADLAESIGKALKASATAKKLAEKIRNDSEHVQGKGADKSVTLIWEYAETSLNELKSQWKKLVRGKTRTFQALVEAAKEANLEGNQRLRMLLSFIEEKATTPPTTEGQAEAIKRQIEELSQSISEIGLEGEVGDFLIRATDGIANPQSLFKPEVKDFIERHGLWNLLKVRLTS